jgi:hypothetical protein
MKCDTQITTRKNKRKNNKKKPRRHNKASITVTPIPLACVWGLFLFFF